MGNVIIEFDLPCAIYLNQGQMLNVMLNGKAYEVSLADKRFLGETRRGYGKAVNMELKNDRYGTFRYSRILLCFKTDNIQVTEEDCIEEARAVANRLLDVYRFATKRAYVEQVKRSDIINPVVKIQLPDSTWKCGAIINFPRGLTGVFPNEPTELQHNIQQLLAEETPIPVHENLLLNAMDYFEKEDFRAALIDGYVAVDVCVELFLRKAYHGWGWSEMQIERHLRFNHNWQIQNRLKCLLKDASGKDLTCNTIRWGAWLRAKRLRDEVAHSGKILSCKDYDTVQTALISMENMVRTVESLKPYSSERNVICL